MLAADKLQLQSALKQQATALKEKEFQLHHSNLMTVGTQAAVLASLDVTMFIEFTVPPDSAWDFNPLVGGYTDVFPRFLKFVYYIAIVVALCANIVVVSHTTILAVFGTSLALRGPDGSMIIATEGLYSERALIFKNFGRGLVATLVACLVGVWLILHWEAATICMVIVVATLRHILEFYNRVRSNFDFDENTEAIDLSDIFAGPANIVGVASDTLSNASRVGRGIRNVAAREFSERGNDIFGAGNFFGRGGRRNNVNNEELEDEGRRLMRDSAV